MFLIKATGVAALLLMGGVSAFPLQGALVRISFGVSGQYQVDGGTIEAGPQPFRFLGDGGTSVSQIFPDALVMTMTAGNCGGPPSNCVLWGSSSGLTDGLGGVFGESQGVGVRDSVDGGNEELRVEVGPDPDAQENITLLFSRPVTLLQVVFTKVDESEDGAWIRHQGGPEFLNASLLSASGLAGGTYTTDNTGVFTTGGLGAPANIAWTGTEFLFSHVPDKEGASGIFLQSIAFEYSPAIVTPEPSTWLLMTGGCLALAVLRRRAAARR